METLKSRFETPRFIQTARFLNSTFFEIALFFKLHIFLKLHVFWNFQIRRFLGPQLMCWSHCFRELEATASNTLNIKHHQWINSVQQNINFGSFHFFSLSTHKDCFSNAKHGGRSWAVCLHCIGRSPPTCCVIIALSSSLYHCSAVSLFVSLQCCRRKPHKFHYTLECAGVRQNILYVCYLYLYYSIFVFCIFFVFHYHCWPSSVVVS